MKILTASLKSILKVHLYRICCFCIVRLYVYVCVKRITSICYLPTDFILTERCSFIKKFGYYHNVLSVGVCNVRVL